jgi:uncharacterized protein (TIGR01777 family)
MRVAVTGASGLLGRAVINHLLSTRDGGSQVLALSRSPHAAAGGVQWLQADVTTAGPWQDAVASADAVVHLAGEPLDSRRWSAAQKARLVQSRVASTERLIEALARPGRRVTTLVAASAVGYYGARGEEPLEEQAAPGHDFLADLCRRWEEAVQDAVPLGVRAVSLRFGVVLSRHGGALARMVPAFKMFVGGPLGDPQAWFPWIHEEDAAGLVLHALTTPSLSGAVNAVSPGLVRMADLARALGRQLNRPSLFRVPTGALRLILGEMGGALAPGQKVIPRAALDAGYRFRHERLDSALAATLS